MTILNTILYVLLATGLYYLFKNLKTFFHSSKLVLKLPGPPARIILGHLSSFAVDQDKLLSTLQEHHKQYYPIYQMHVLHRFSANLLSPEDSEIILANPVHNTKGIFYRFLDNWLKEGLLTSNREKWQHRRRILTSAFHFNILQHFVLIFNEKSKDLVEDLMKESENSYVNVTEQMTQFTLKAIAETAMGTKLTFKTEKEKIYKKTIIEMTRLVLYKITHPWFVLKGMNYFNPKYLEERRANKILHRFTSEIIQTRKNTYTETTTTEEHDVYKERKRLAMLDLLISAKNEDSIDDAGIQEEVDTFLFEGHDTTAMSLSYILMLLACNAQAQNLILEEMSEVLGDIHKEPEYVDLQNLKYLERCIKEAIRLYPVVFFISRTLGEDIKTHSGYELLKGTEVFIHILGIHRNPDIYPEPENFDPDRFLPENVKNRHPFAFLPFSAGSRNCIGQKFALLELKAVICAILANFILEPIDTPQTITLIADIVLRTKEDIKVKFIPRN